jgi:hypothetical protein
MKIITINIFFLLLLNLLTGCGKSSTNKLDLQDKRKILSQDLLSKDVIKNSNNKGVHNQLLSAEKVKVKFIAEEKTSMGEPKFIFAIDLPEIEIPFDKNRNLNGFYLDIWTLNDRLTYMTLPLSGFYASGAKTIIKPYTFHISVTKELINRETYVYLSLKSSTDKKFFKGFEGINFYWSQKYSNKELTYDPDKYLVSILSVNDKPIINNGVYGKPVRVTIKHRVGGTFLDKNNEEDRNLLEKISSGKIDFVFKDQYNNTISNSIEPNKPFLAVLPASYVETLNYNECKNNIDSEECTTKYSFDSKARPNIGGATYYIYSKGHIDGDRDSIYVMAYDIDTHKSATATESMQVGMTLNHQTPDLISINNSIKEFHYSLNGGLKISNPNHPSLNYKVLNNNKYYGAYVFQKGVMCAHLLNDDKELGLCENEYGDSKDAVFNKYLFGYWGYSPEAMKEGTVASKRLIDEFYLNDKYQITSQRKYDKSTDSDKARFMTLFDSYGNYKTFIKDNPMDRYSIGDGFDSNNFRYYFYNDSNEDLLISSCGDGDGYRKLIGGMDLEGKREDLYKNYFFLSPKAVTRVSFFVEGLPPFFKQAPYFHNLHSNTKVCLFRFGKERIEEVSNFHLTTNIRWPDSYPNSYPIKDSRNPIDTFNAGNADYYIYTKLLDDSNAASAVDCDHSKMPSECYFTGKIFDTYIQVGQNNQRSERRFFDLSSKLKEEDRKNYFQMDYTTLRKYGEF